MITLGLDSSFSDSATGEALPSFSWSCEPEYFLLGGSCGDLALDLGVPPSCDFCFWLGGVTGSLDMAAWSEDVEKRTQNAYKISLNANLHWCDLDCLKRACISWIFILFLLYVDYSKLRKIAMVIQNKS